MTHLASRDLEHKARSGTVQVPAPRPCTLILFGASGDLARRKLVPALYNLMVDGVLPAGTTVVGLARKPYTDDTFRALLRDAANRYSRRSIDADRWAELERSVHYVAGSLEDGDALERLRERLDELEATAGASANRIFYLSIPPSQIEAAVQGLKRARLVRSYNDEHYSRVIVEKPLGHDLASATAVNETLAQVFDERQIFRIDHYLGKETVQNILVLRFGNSIFEPLWNQKYVDHVQITVAEEEGVGTRATYYEEAGALRDMVQNHILQVLCMVAMEPPWSLDADVVRDAKIAVLRSLRPIDPTRVDSVAVRAQYAAGTHRGESVPGYRTEPGIDPASTTETYVALEARVDNWRWSGVPFYLRTGKALPKRMSEVAVQFKEVPPVLFAANERAPLEPNVLALRLQPDEGLSLGISTKHPGPQIRPTSVHMDFQYGSAFGDQSPEAYERLLLDVMAGDATLFMRRDAVEAAWGWVGDILDGWQRSGQRYLPAYRAGSPGPVEADELLESNGRRWRRI